MTHFYCGKDKVLEIAELFGVTVPGTVSLEKPAKEYPLIVDTIGANVPSTLRLKIDQHGQYYVEHE